jgi:G:T/U-mismatch repair DNA glycosylase
METHPYLTTQGFIEQLNYLQDEIDEKGFIDGGVWFKDTKTIICGTFPPITEYLNRRGYLHYSSNRNKFWRHIDAIYNINLYLNDNNDNSRINQSKLKIEFLKKSGIGFIDIYTKIERLDNQHARDTDIVEIETIFETKIFETILNSNVKQIIFVYQNSYSIFKEKLVSIYQIGLRRIREKGAEGLPLEIYEVEINGRKLLLKYSPIHGRITDDVRRPSLRIAIED